MSVTIEQGPTLTTTELVEKLIAQAKRTSAKPKKAAEDEDEAFAEDVEDTPKSGRASSKAADDEDDEDLEEEEDDWNKGDEEESWDPDFEEFDLPKSKKGASKKGEDDDDFKFEDDEEFKDLFNDSGSGFDDEDDDF